jgi:hypothetical protein
VAAWSVQEACGGRDSRSGSSLQRPGRAGGWPGGWQPATPLNGRIGGAGGERCGRAHAAVRERCDAAARGAYHNFNVILSIRWYVVEYRVRRTVAGALSGPRLGPK